MNRRDLLRLAAPAAAAALVAPVAMVEIADTRIARMRQLLGPSLAQAALPGYGESPAASVTPTRQDLIARAQAAVLDLKASYTDADVTADGDLRQIADGILRILDQVFTA